MPTIDRKTSSGHRFAIRYEPGSESMVLDKLEEWVRSFVTSFSYLRGLEMARQLDPEWAQAFATRFYKSSNFTPDGGIDPC